MSDIYVKVEAVMVTPKYFKEENVLGCAMVDGKALGKGSNGKSIDFFQLIINPENLANSSTVYSS